MAKEKYFRVVRMIKEEYFVTANDKTEAENLCLMEGDPARCTMTSLRITEIKEKPNK